MPEQAARNMNYAYIDTTVYSGLFSSLGYGFLSETTTHRLGSVMETINSGS